MAAQQESVRLIRIFASSPGDVAQERKTLDDVIGAINEVQGRQSGVRLEAWKWEDQVVPQIGPSPQTVVDTQLPPFLSTYFTASDTLSIFSDLTF
jgi:hypothetical protein